MTHEDHHTDRKSLRTVTGKTADWDALVKYCVCFANGAGGRLLIGIEDDEALPPEWLRGAQLDRKTTPSRITPHRFQALILEDLTRYPDSASTDINRRIGAEISAKTVKRALDDLVEDGRVIHEGERRWRRYRLSGQEPKRTRCGEVLMRSRPQVPMKFISPMIYRHSDKGHDRALSSIPRQAVR